MSNCQVSLIPVSPKRLGWFRQHLGRLLDPGALPLIAVLVTAKQTRIAHAISPLLKASQYFLLLFISHLGLYNRILWAGQRKQQPFISHSSGSGSLRPGCQHSQVLCEGPLPGLKTARHPITWQRNRDRRSGIRERERKRGIKREDEFLPCPFS